MQPRDWLMTESISMNIRRRPIVIGIKYAVYFYRAMHFSAYALSWDRKLTQVHMPRGSTIESDTVFGVTCQLPLLREEFGIATLTFHSDLQRRAASRRALPCPSSFLCIACFNNVL